MSEEHSPAPAPAAEEPVPATAPIPEPAAPVEAPPQPTEQGPAEGAAVETPPAAPETPAEPAIKPHTDEPGLLTPETPPEEAKPAEGEKPSEAPPPEPASYEFAVPEGFTVPDERLTELTTVMREANVPKEQAEKLWDMHTAAMKAMGTHYEQALHDQRAESRRTERNRIAADPEFGGAGLNTNISAARRVLDLMARDPDPAKQAANHEEMNKWLKASDATDSYVLFKGLVRLSRLYDEPQGGPPPNPAPLPPRDAMGQRPRGGTAGELSGNGQRRINYDHPRGGNRT